MTGGPWETWLDGKDQTTLEREEEREKKARASTRRIGLETKLKVSGCRHEQMES